MLTTLRQRSNPLEYRVQPHPPEQEIEVRSTLRTSLYRNMCDYKSLANLLTKMHARCIQDERTAKDTAANELRWFQSRILCVS